MKQAHVVLVAIVILVVLVATAGVSFYVGERRGEDRGGDEGYANGFVTGHTQGLTEGRGIGWRDGHNEGVAEGYEIGQVEGFEDGYKQGWDSRFSDKEERWANGAAITLGGLGYSWNGTRWAAPDRIGDCGAIRGTDYRSTAERIWFLANCNVTQATSNAERPGYSLADPQSDEEAKQSVPCRWGSSHFAGRQALTRTGLNNHHRRSELAAM